MLYTLDLFVVLPEVIVVSGGGVADLCNGGDFIFGV